jgi:hypothetical protein
MAYSAFADWIASRYCRNVETGLVFIQVATANMQEITRHQMKMLCSNAEQILKVSKEMVIDSSLGNAASKQADFTRNWLEDNMNGVHELVELGTRSVHGMCEVVSKHISEQAKEFPDAAASAHHSQKKKAA